MSFLNIFNKIHDSIYFLDVIIVSLVEATNVILLDVTKIFFGIYKLLINLEELKA